MNTKAKFENTQKIGLNTAELIESMLDVLEKKAVIDVVLKAAEVSGSYAQLLKTLCNSTGLNPKEVGMIEAMASMDRLITLVEKLEGEL